MLRLIFHSEPTQPAPSVPYARPGRAKRTLGLRCVRCAADDRRLPRLVRNCAAGGAPCQQGMRTGEAGRHGALRGRT